MNQKDISLRALLHGKYGLCLLMILILSITIRFLWLNTTIERDEGTFAYIGWRLLEGEKLYSELHDLKGPVTYFLYAASLGLLGNNIQSVRLLNNILFLVSVPVFFLLVRKWYGVRIAFFAASIYGIFMSTPIYEGHLAMTESLSIPIIVSSIYLAELRCEPFRESVSKVLSGTLMSVAFLIRQTAIAGLLLLVLLICVDERSFGVSSIKRGLSERKIWCVLLGISLPLLVVIIYFVLNGTFSAFVHQVVMRPLNQIQVGAGGPSFGYDPFPRVLLIAEALPLWTFGVAGTLNCVTDYHPRHLKGLLWLLLFSFMVAIPPSFGHIYLIILPPLSVFAGIYTAKLLNKFSARSVIILFTPLLVASAFFQTLQYPDTTIHNIPELGTWNGYLLYSDFRTYSEQLSLASYLRQNGGTTDNILVYGMEPEIYWLSGYKSPTRDTWSIHLGFEEQVTLLEKLKRHEFRYVVLFERLMESYPDDSVINYVRSNYNITEIIGFAYVYSF